MNPILKLLCQQLQNWLAQCELEPYRDAPPFQQAVLLAPSVMLANAFSEAACCNTTERKGCLPVQTFYPQRLGQKKSLYVYVYMYVHIYKYK